MFGSLNIIFIFAFELRNANPDSSVHSSGIFLLPFSKHSIGLLNRLVVVAKHYLGFAKSRFNGLFLFINNFSFREMRIPNENASNARSASTSRLTSAAVKKHTIGNPADITVTLTGVKNPYLYSIRKSFKEFLQEETRGILSSDLRLTKKIEAARLLFPQSRDELRGLTVKIK